MLYHPGAAPPPEPSPQPYPGHAYPQHPHQGQQPHRWHAYHQPAHQGQPPHAGHIIPQQPLQGSQANQTLPYPGMPTTPIKKNSPKPWLLAAVGTVMLLLFLFPGIAISLGCLAGSAIPFVALWLNKRWTASPHMVCPHCLNAGQVRTRQGGKVFATGEARCAVCNTTWTIK